MGHDSNQLYSALRIIERLECELSERRQHAFSEPIALVGMSCRFNGADTLDELWSALELGRPRISEVPKDRWDVDALFDPDPDAPGKMSTRYGGFLPRIADFDASFFNISPREAALMDPQQRLLLELSWEALENAGISADALYGRPCGVFVGICASDYGRLALQSPENVTAYLGTGMATSVAAGRIAYTFGFTGPCVSLDTACSSALVAVHCAIDSLRKHECEVALAGSSNLVLAPEITMAFSRARMMAPDGRCKAFDERANGYVRAEGAAVVVLKTLQRAQADGDPIVAVIRGSAVNQDGASGGLTVPNGPSQVALIRRALQDARLDPAHIDYVEAHGTGTSLGDPIEVGALAQVFGGDREAERPLALGSVKTVLGHTEVAAGMAGLLKIALALKHERIPGYPELERLSSRIPWDELPFVVPRHGRPWPAGDRPRRAGLSAFGFSGTNAHLIIEEAPSKPESPQPSRSASNQTAHLLCLSAKNEGALQALCRRYCEWLERNPDADIDAVCWTAHSGRAHFAHRTATVATSGEQLREQLSRCILGQSPMDGGAIAGVAPAVQPPLAFLFSGQGSQYVGMGRSLYEQVLPFQKAIDRCEALLQKAMAPSLTDVLWGTSTHLLSQTEFTQPALFALEYALAQLWLSWGLRPTHVLGHSVGEYVAACVAGVFSLQDGLRLIAARGRLMQQLRGDGAMAVVAAGCERVRPVVDRYGDKASIAAINSPQQTVVSGCRVMVAEVCERLRVEFGILTTGMLNVSHAFHSPLMRPMLDDFRSVASTVAYSLPSMNVISNVTGRSESTALADPDYWVRHVLASVDFLSSVQQLERDGVDVLLEVGPKATLLALAKECAGHDRLTTLASLNPRRDDWAQLLSCLGTLFVKGAPIDWTKAGRREQGSPAKLVLPTYPFQRRRFWFATRDAPAQPVVQEKCHALLGPQVLNAVLKAGQFQFENVLRPDSPPYLEDHRVYDDVVVPAAAYVEMVCAASRRLFPDQTAAIQNLTIQSALVLPARADTRVQTLCSAIGDGRYRIEIFSTTPSAEAGLCSVDWRLHATAEISLSNEALPTRPGPDDLPQIIKEFEQRGEVLALDAFYRQYQELGLSYGESFRTLTRLLRLSHEEGLPEILAEVTLPAPTGPSSSQDYTIHPALLDGCFQALGALLVHGDHEVVYLPVGIERAYFVRFPTRTIWARARLVASSAAGYDRPCVDLRLIDSDGHLIGAVEGLQAVQVGRRALIEATATWKESLYELTWRLQQPAVVNRASEPGQWLLLADQSGVARSVADALRFAGDACVVVSEEELRYDDVAGWSGCLQQFSESAAPLKGVIHLWAADERAIEPGEHELERIQRRLCASALALVQALAQRRGHPAPRLWFVTVGGHAVLESEQVRPVQALLWGLGRSVALEYPGLLCTCVDLDPSCEGVGPLGSDLLRPDDELQVAYRDGRRYVARLERARVMARAGARLAMPNGPYRLRTLHYGTLDQLSLLPAPQSDPGPHEVEIEVRAASVNFKDVLYCFGSLRAFSEQAGIHRAGDQPLGFECAGKVSRLGAEVKGFAVGDHVVAMVPSAMASYVIADHRLVHRKPCALSFEQAASVPTIFMTARYALDRLARLQPGERVLVHACAGGVGQAALQIALARGATVFGTASPAKWDHLKRQGVAHVMNSRTHEFSTEIMQLTQGRGVDVVLNSLNGPLIAKSVDALCKGGRFIEIGKVDIWDAQRMAEYRPDVQYFSFDLGEVEGQAELQAELLGDVMEGVATGTLVVPPVKTFDIRDAQAGFRHLAAARNIGKVVLTLPIQGNALRLRQDRSYLITGGWGAIGLHIAESLAACGARQLVLSGRSRPSEQAAIAITELRKRGVQVVEKAMDVTELHQVQALLRDLASEVDPLGGVVHAAGILDDGLLADQTWARFSDVLGPKVAGAWNLHVATRALELDFFVAFSSLAGLLGSAGQASYAAANAFLNALCAHRKSAGLPALCIDWGPWDVGMAEISRTASRTRFNALGLRRMTARQCVAAFEYLRASACTVVAVADLDWSRYVRTLSSEASSRFYELVVRVQPVVESRDSAPLRAVLLQLPQEERAEALVEHLRKNVALVLGAPPDLQLALDQPLLSIGIDSLMALELKNRIESSLGCTLNPTLLVEHPTLQALTQYLQTVALTGGAAGPSSPSRPAREPAQPSDAISDSRLMHSMRETFVEAPDGRRLCVCQWGEHESGALAVCVHGILDQAPSWEGVASGLVANGFRVLALDLRGHGRSDHHARDASLTIMDFVADLVTVLGTLPGGELTLIGHSMGAVVAGLLATLQPERVKHLIMLEPVTPSLRDQHAPLELLNNELRYMKTPPPHPLLPDLLTAAQMLSASHPQLSTERAHELASRVTEPTGDGLRWCWDPRLRNPFGVDLCFSRDRYLSLLSGLKMPSTRIYGTASQYAQTAVLVDPSLVLPGSEAVHVTGGHNLHTDNPTAVIEEVLRAVQGSPRANMEVPCN